MTPPDAGQEGGVCRKADGPLFVSEDDGRISANVLDLAASRRFSLAKLALSFANPWLEEEIRPECPWEAVRRFAPRPSLPPLGSSDLAELVPRFRAAVAAAIGDASTVVVLYSGGMDSTAVLVHASELCRREGRRLVAVTWGLRDQFGESTGTVAHRVLHGLGLDCETVVLPPQWRDLPEPAWSPLGPRHDYYTRLYQATVDLADARGAGVILSGEGGDEVLAAWHFLSGPLARERRWRDLAQYTRGFLAGESVVPVAGEALAAVARWLPTARSFRLYTTLALSGSLRPLPAPVLTPVYEQVAVVNRREWLAERAAVFAELHREWLAVALWDMVFPFAHDPYPVSAGIPSRSPFFDDEFVRYAFGLPPAARFAAASRHPYHWYKALHFRLLPDAAVALLPTAKQDYYDEFRRHAMELLPDGPLECVRLGLLRPVSKDGLERIHRRLPIVVRNIENWVVGALDFGAEPVPAVP